jgi:prepilin-type N-terminal cleavage/methylation domain-containing protein
MKFNRFRRGFTLVELLVVMSLIAILATLAIAFLPNAASSQVEARAGTQLQSWLTMAKQRAMRDQAPRGLRLWVNNTSFYAGATLMSNVVTNCQFIEEPPDFPGTSKMTIMTGSPTNPSATNAVMFMPAGAGVLVNGYLPINVAQTEYWTVQPGDNLEILGTGLMHQITQVGVPDAKGHLNADYVAVSPPLPYPIAATANFRVMRAPRVTGDETLMMPEGTVIDLQTNLSFGNSLPPTNSFDNGTSLYVDILFSPTGEVISPGVTNSNINLWVRSPNTDHPTDIFRGAPTIVSVFTKTGFVGAFQPSSGTPTTPYLLIK